MLEIAIKSYLVQKLRTCTQLNLLAVRLVKQRPDQCCKSTWFVAVNWCDVIEFAPPIPVFGLD